MKIKSGCLLDIFFHAIFDCFFNVLDMDKSRKYETYQTRQQNIVPVMIFEMARYRITLGKSLIRPSHIVHVYSSLFLNKVF